MTAGPAASRRVLARTPVAPLPASSPTRPVGINGRTSAPPDSSLPDVCSFRLPLTLCRIEHRPPQLDLAQYPHLPAARVATTAAADYLALLGAGTE